MSISEELQYAIADLDHAMAGDNLQRFADVFNNDNFRSLTPEEQRAAFDAIWDSDRFKNIDPPVQQARFVETAIVHIPDDHKLYAYSRAIESASEEWGSRAHFRVIEEGFWQLPEKDRLAGYSIAIEALNSNRNILPNEVKNFHENVLRALPSDACLNAQKLYQAYLDGTLNTTTQSLSGPAP